MFIQKREMRLVYAYQDCEGKKLMFEIVTESSFFLSIGVHHPLRFGTRQYPELMLITAEVQLLHRTA
jgi:hypothetical protein